MHGTPAGDWTSAGIVSDGSYGVPEGLISSFPVTSDGGSWQIVQDLTVDEFSRAGSTRPSRSWSRSATRCRRWACSEPVWAEEVRVPLPGTGVAAFLGWVLLGAGIGAGFGLGILAGLFVALALVLVGGLLVVRQGLRPAQLGVVTGLGALPFALAWLNRRGPGPVCPGV